MSQIFYIAIIIASVIVAFGIAATVPTGSDAVADQSTSGSDPEGINRVKRDLTFKYSDQLTSISGSVVAGAGIGAAVAGPVGAGFGALAGVAAAAFYNIVRILE